MRSDGLETKNAIQGGARKPITPTCRKNYLPLRLLQGTRLCDRLPPDALSVDSRASR